MKKFFLVLSVIGMVACGFASCGDDEEEENNDSKKQEQTSGEDKVYAGTMNIVMADSSLYTNSSAECVVACDSSMTLILLNAKFAEKMPSFDTIKVEGIAYSKDNQGNVKFEGESLVPTLMGKPFAQYTISGLDGAVKGDSLTFSCVMGQFPVRYDGALK